MPSTDRRDKIIERLVRVFGEMRTQHSTVENLYPPERLSFREQVAQIDEYISVNEYGIAYECIVADLEWAPFTLSSAAAIALLEVGLLMQFKTERDCDVDFDFRR